jgi:hypothetical protein
MKYCPTCETRFDDEVMRFCTKDGTPLIDEEQPNFIAIPSEEFDEPAAIPADEDEAGEVTVVRRNIAVPPPPGLDDSDFSSPNPRPAERIVVPMAAEPAPDPFRNRNAAAYYPPHRQNTFKVVFLTVIGTLFVLGFGAALFMLLRPNQASNTNLNFNANLNANQNANLGFDSNFNFNVNPTIPSSNINTNFNTNVKTPTPTPSPTATPTPRPSVSPTPTPHVEITPATPRISPTPDTGRPRTTPTEQPPTMMRASPRPSPRITP